MSIIWIVLKSQTRAMGTIWSVLFSQIRAVFTIWSNCSIQHWRVTIHNQSGLWIELLSLLKLWCCGWKTGAKKSRYSVNFIAVRWNGKEFPEENVNRWHTACEANKIHSTALLFALKSGQKSGQNLEAGAWFPWLPPLALVSELLPAPLLLVDLRRPPPELDPEEDTRLFSSISKW